MGSILSSALNTKHTLNIELWVRHSALHSKIFISNNELWHWHSALHSTTYKLWIWHSKTRHSFNIVLWVRHSALHSKIFILKIKLWDRHSALHLKIIHIFNIELWVRHSAVAFENMKFWTSSYEIDVQLCIQHHTHFEYRAMGSTFSSDFETFHLDYRAVSLIFSSAYKSKHILNIELWDRHSGLYSKQLIFEYWAVGSIFSSAFNTIHTLNIELWVRHLVLHLKIFISNIEQWDRRSFLHSTTNELWISSCGSTFSSAFENQT